ncbi:MAG: hypothetical protein HC905_21910 [Bacteroidales bacterium]|nr:hypothetical protein [Bacteroidales bacterium]
MFSLGFKLSALPIDSTDTSNNLILSVVFFDFPYQISFIENHSKEQGYPKSFICSYANPSMKQSLSVTSSLYSAAHFGIDRLFKVQPKYRDTKRKALHMASILLTDYLITYMPGGDAWLHEEYHRAVLNDNNVSSFNGINKFPIGSEFVSVNDLKDENLIRFKKESPKDFIRMHVAGIEGEYLLIDKLQQNNFFYGLNISHELHYWLVTLNSMYYVQASSDPEYVDVDTDRFNETEKEVKDRDFTGYDFSAWAYDLHKPNEPYEQRGIHPLGNGVDRYIKTNDLTQEQLRYLKNKGDFKH